MTLLADTGVVAPGWASGYSGERERVLTREREPEQTERAAALRTVACYATGRADLLELLDALGLTDQIPARKKCA